MQYSRFAENIRPNRQYNLTTNTIMLVTHLAFILLYLKMKAPLLFAYNLVSVTTFLINYFFAWTRRDHAFYGIMYGEVFVFTTLNLLLLGWGYGFELYCFSYAISIQMVGLFLFNEEWAKKLYIIVGGITAVYFLGMRLLLYQISPLYPASNVTLQHSIYLSNAVFSLILCVNYVGVYTKLVYGLTSDLHYSSTHDTLTDLYNRRRMLEIMRERARADIAVAMLDIDDFKAINDTFGHAAGDAVLRDLAERLRTLDGEGIVSSRWGGEEFVIFFGKGMETGEPIDALLETFIRQIEGATVAFEGRELRYTVTVGLAFGGANAEAHRLIDAADALLYEGKQTGKNRLIVGGV